MATDYDVLALFYNQLGLAEFATNLTPILLDYAQRHEWLGRRILDLGCGTGASTLWLAEHSYTITGVDTSAAMIQIARSSLDDTRGLIVDFQNHDIRNLDDDFGGVDMTIALNVMNEMDSVRDIQAVFEGVYRALKDEKLFIFDMYTIEGLTSRGLRNDDVAVDDGVILTVFRQYSYDYERQVQTTRYITFSNEDDNRWQRIDGERSMRAFPIQAIAALLQRSHFRDIQVLDISMQPTNPSMSGLGRVVFVAKK